MSAAAATPGRLVLAAAAEDGAGEEAALFGLARSLRDAGLDVVLLGRASPRAVVQAARHEDPAAVICAAVSEAAAEAFAAGVRDGLAGRQPPVAALALQAADPEGRVLALAVGLAGQPAASRPEARR